MFTPDVLVLASILIGALCVGLGIYLSRPKNTKKTVTHEDYSPTHDVAQRQSGKSNKMACRRKSRQRPYNGAWRQK